MEKPHVIRLRGPWEYEPLARSERQANGELREVTSDLPAAGRQQLPGDWSQTLGAEFRGRVAYRRRFGRPTNLSGRERVELVVDQIDASGHLELNSELLGEIPPGLGRHRFDVTSLLQPRNELLVVVELPATIDGDAESPSRPGREGLAGGPIGDIQLEISTSSIPPSTPS